jgi:hypothetical protein
MRRNEPHILAMFGFVLLIFVHGCSDKLLVLVFDEKIPP